MVEPFDNGIEFEPVFLRDKNNNVTVLEYDTRTDRYIPRAMLPLGPTSVKMVKRGKLFYPDRFEIGNMEFLLDSDGNSNMVKIDGGRWISMDWPHTFKMIQSASGSERV